jgi:hypothetical protein
MTDTLVLNDQTTHINRKNKLVMFVAILFVPFIKSEPMRTINIDGNFTDWQNVPKRNDPYQRTMDAPNVTDGFPPLPDVHDTVGSDLCANHSSRWNPVVDVMQVAVAHDVSVNRDVLR